MIDRVYPERNNGDLNYRSLTVLDYFIKAEFEKRGLFQTTAEKVLAQKVEQQVMSSIMETLSSHEISNLNNALGSIEAMKLALDDVKDKINQIIEMQTERSKNEKV